MYWIYKHKKHIIMYKRIVFSNCIFICIWKHRQHISTVGSHVILEPVQVFIYRNLFLLSKHSTLNCIQYVAILSWSIYQKSLKSELNDNVGTYKSFINKVLPGINFFKNLSDFRKWVANNNNLSVSLLSYCIKLPNYIL